MINIPLTEVGEMDVHDQIQEYERSIAELDRIIARLSSKNYEKEYKQEQWRAWVRYFFTRKLPKNKEWRFTTCMVKIPVLSLFDHRSQNRFSVGINRFLLLIQQMVWNYWAKNLPFQVTLENGKLIVPVPHLIREDTDEHRQMLDMFRSEKIQQLNDLKNGTTTSSSLLFMHGGNR
jgi:hypothetical protein